MGFWLWESFGEKDKEIINEISKEHKVDIKVVAEHYKDLLEAIKNEIKD